MEVESWNEKLPFVPHLRVTLEKSWYREGKPIESIKYPTGCRPDQDIVVMSFLRLSDLCFSVSPQHGAMITNEPDSSDASLLHKTIKQVGSNKCYRIKSKSGNFHGDEWLADTRLFLDRKLDVIPGPSAPFLRLERFQHWYVDGNSWTSAYEKQLITDLRTNYQLVLKHDPGLRATFYRHNLLLLFHHQLYQWFDDPWAVQAALENRFIRLYVTWNSLIWPPWPHGLHNLEAIHSMLDWNR